MCLGCVYFFRSRYGRRLERSFENETVLRKAKRHLLVIFAIWLIIVAIGSLYFYMASQGENRRRIQQEEQEQTQAILVTEMHRIKRMDLQETKNGFDVVFESGGGLAGDYLLDIQIQTRFDNNTVFLQRSENISFSSGAQEIKRTVLYDDLFADCGGRLQVNLHCVGGNAGALFLVRGKLALLGTEGEVVADKVVVSTATARFALDYNKIGDIFFVQRFYNVKPFIK